MKMVIVEQVSFQSTPLIFWKWSFFFIFHGVKVGQKTVGMTSSGLKGPSITTITLRKARWDVLLNSWRVVNDVIGILIHNKAVTSNVSFPEWKPTQRKKWPKTLCDLAPCDIFLTTWLKSAWCVALNTSRWVLLLSVSRQRKYRICFP